MGDTISIGIITSYFHKTLQSTNFRIGNKNVHILPSKPLFKKLIFIYFDNHYVQLSKSQTEIGIHQFPPQRLSRAEQGQSNKPGTTLQCPCGCLIHSSKHPFSPRVHYTKLDQKGSNQDSKCHVDILNGN